MWYYWLSWGYWTGLGFPVGSFLCHAACHQSWIFPRSLWCSWVLQWRLWASLGAGCWCSWAWTVVGVSWVSRPISQRNRWRPMFECKRVCSRTWRLADWKACEYSIGCWNGRPRSNRAHRWASWWCVIDSEGMPVWLRWMMWRSWSPTPLGCLSSRRDCSECMSLKPNKEFNFVFGSQMKLDVHLARRSFAISEREFTATLRFLSKMKFFS